MGGIKCVISVGASVRVIVDAIVVRNRSRNENEITLVGTQTIG